VTDLGKPPRRRVEDLSLLLAEDFPCHWATHLPFQVKTYNWFTAQSCASQAVADRLGPYATRWMAIDEHTGTHVDAPSHFIAPPGSGLPNSGDRGAVSVERLDLQRMMGPAAVIDVPADVDVPTAGTSPLIEPEVVLAWERRHGPLEGGDVVLLHTGWDRHYQRGPAGRHYTHDVVVTKQAPGWPAPSVATVELLLERGVLCVGTDGASIGAAHDAAPVHLLGLGAGMVVIECLANLGSLPPRGAWFCFLPLCVEGGTGAPGRAMALLP
jgi:kynurenine formamidase